MKKINTNISYYLKLIGGFLILLSPVVFALVPPLLTDYLCNSGVGTGCGYKNLGITGYALYIALVPFIIGLVLLVTSFVVKKRK